MFYFFQGIYTGSIYAAHGDPELLKKGYLGEGVRNGSVVAIKTHAIPIHSGRRIQRAIVVIRNPYDAMFADFNRRATDKHTGIAPAASFVKSKIIFAQIVKFSFLQLHKFENLYHQVEDKLPMHDLVPNQ